MNMKILDPTGTCILVDVDGKWHLRMTAESMLKEMPQTPYVWYKFQQAGWASLGTGALYDDMEAAYQEQLKVSTQ